MSPSTLSPPRRNSLLAGSRAINMVGAIDLSPLPSRRQQRPFVFAFWGKGGAGKTTTALQLAGAAAYLGYRVLILDVDPQGSAAAWRTLRDNGKIGVQTGRPDEVEKLIDRARAADFDLVLIDNAPGRNSYISRVASMASLSIVLARASAFDLLIGNDWANLIADRRFVMIISAAPPIRQDQQSPLVREARSFLRGHGARVWRGQLTARNTVAQSTALGLTLIEADPLSLAALEYARLWNALVSVLLGDRK